MQRSTLQGGVRDVIWRVFERDIFHDANAATHNEPRVADTRVLHLEVVRCWSRLAYTLARLAWPIAITVTTGIAWLLAITVTTGVAWLAQSHLQVARHCVIGAPHHQDGGAMVAQIGGYNSPVCASVHADVDGGDVSDSPLLGRGRGASGTPTGGGASGPLPP